MENIETLPVKNTSSNKLYLIIIVASVIFGSVTGYLLSSNKQTNSPQPIASTNSSVVNSTPQHASLDNQTFKDFAEGVLQKRPDNKSDEYTEGTHILVRTGATPVAITSSVIDLTQYEGKKVKVFGETQKAIKAGWLMDVGKVEVEN